MVNNSQISSRWRWAVPSVLILGVLAYLVFDHLIKDRVLPKRWGEVESGLVYRAGQIHPALIATTLQENGIEKIIDLQYWEEKPGLLAERDAAFELQIEIERFPLNGNGTGDVQNYVRAILALHQAKTEGTPVLVHCAAGSQRTGGVMAAYQTLVHGLSANDAVAEMESFDWDPAKDQILLDYLNEHIAYIAEQLVLGGVIGQVPTPLPYFSNPLSLSAD